MKRFTLVTGGTRLLPRHARNLIVLLMLVVAESPRYAQGSPATASAQTRVFCGSTPCDETIRKLLGISTNELAAVPELMEWKLDLRRDSKTGVLSTYRLRCDIGVTIPNKPGIGRVTGTLEKKGEIKSGGVDRGAAFYDLKDAVLLREVSSNVLHVLNRDGTLLVGNGGWTYTLNAVDHSEKLVDPALARTVPDMSYPIAPMATNAVFGVFEGRSPCLGIARQWGIAVPESATKAKWRITFFKNPDTHAPTSYKIEGTLFRAEPRVGRWSMSRGSGTNGNSTIYELTVGKGQPSMRLLKGDDNVLFFLDARDRPLVGNCEFSYTLNRVTQR